jgi:hypothetical protein
MRYPTRYNTAQARTAGVICRRKILIPLTSPHAMMAAFPPSRGPDAGPGGETVGEERLSSGDGNSAAGPAIMVPPEAGPRTKADRDGRPLAPLLLNGRVKGRPLPVTVSRKAGRHFGTSEWQFVLWSNLRAKQGRPGPRAARPHIAQQPLASPVPHATCALRRAWWNGRHTGLKIRRG